MLEQSREVFLNIPSLVKTIFYIAAALATAIFFIGFWLRLSIWSKGKPDPQDLVSNKSVLGMVGMVLFYFFSKECLLAKRVVERSRLRALMLIFVYWGFIVLFIGTLIVAVDYDLGLGILKGAFYLNFSILLDIAGGLFLIGVLFFILRRYIFARDEVVSGWDDAVVLILMFLIAFSGFCAEGIRLAWLAPPAMDWSPVGTVFSLVFKTLISDEGTLLLSYRFFWILHATFALFFIAFLPFSKQFHMFAAQITTLEATMRKSKEKELVHE
jgi:nitrate reductase gamma subunit